MWIEELPDGRFKYIERYEDPLTGQLKRVSAIRKNKTRQTQKEYSDPQKLDFLGEILYLSFFVFTKHTQSSLPTRPCILYTVSRVVA